MEILVMLLIMAIVGAIIGGITNSIAIKMLFRPYKAKYIGKHKLPFTPGLIPKRQAEMAEQMGKTVVNHLITAEGLKRKINNEAFIDQVMMWINLELSKLETSDFTIQDVLNRFNLPINKTYLEEKTKVKLDEKITELLKRNQNKTLQTIVPSHIEKQVEEYIPKLTQYLLNQIDGYISSNEGKEKLGQIAGQYLNKRGFFSNMISSFLGGDGLAEKIQPAIHQFLNSPEAKNMVGRLLKEEYDKWLTKEVKEIESYLNINQLQKNAIEKIISFISFDQVLQMKIRDIYKKYGAELTNHFISDLVKNIRNYLLDKMPIILDRLNLQEIVREEVEQFDLFQLEDMVLGIAKRELKMITYLGALLGGLIGLVQGVLVLIIT